MRALERAPQGETRCPWCQQVAELTQGTCSVGCALAMQQRPPSVLPVAACFLMAGIIIGGSSVGYLLGGIFQ